MQQGNNTLKSPKIKVPVIIVATSPFSTITLNNEDCLNFTLDEINQNTYDHLKLCRTTMSIDGDIPEMTEIGAGVIVSYTGADVHPKINTKAS
jgi:hypothetical protein